MAGKFELKTSPTGKYYFNLKAGNGQIILSSEMYETKEGALRGIEAIKRNAQNSALFDRRTTFNGDPYFILKAGNGMEIGRSETFTGRNYTKMEQTIESVKSNSSDAEIISLAA